jgi:plastocyanin
MSRRSTLVLLLALAAAAVAVGVALAAGTTLRLSADKVALKFDKKALRAEAGKVTLVMANPSVLPHNIAIKGKGIKTVLGKIVLKGGTSTVSATLKKGTYTFFCSVPGHEAAGMKGTLKVE